MRLPRVAAEHEAERRAMLAASCVGEGALTRASTRGRLVMSCGVARFTLYMVVLAGCHAAGRRESPQQHGAAGDSPEPARAPVDSPEARAPMEELYRRAKDAVRRETGAELAGVE